MLSFILPVFKPRASFDKCIKSLLDQSLKEIELIFVLDGPNESAKATIKAHMKKATVPHKIIEIEHSGANKARNAGFAESKGDYVIFWDCDCVIEPEAAKAWVDILDRKPELGFVYGGYKFSDEKGAIASEPFDPWLLKVRNYISSCFPVRRSLFPGWNESLKSLQDWDFWLSVVEKGGVGKYLGGYAFSTDYPDPESISGKGCTDEAWLERVDAVKKAHNLPDRDTCVCSMQYKADGIALAKYLDADYQDYPNFKPHKYKNIIQVGFSLHPRSVEAAANCFSDKKTKNYLFWTGDNIEEFWNRVSLNAIDKYSILLNNVATQYCEDKNAQKLLERAGFKVSVLPMPFQNTKEIVPLPKEPTFAVDIDPVYSQIFNVLDKSLPDIKMEILDGAKPINDYTGLVHIYPDKTMSSSIKRMLLAGRHVISNIQAPYSGFITDEIPPDEFIPKIVDKIREVAKKSENVAARDYYSKAMGKDKLVEAMR